jgi:Ca-activated chloride channel homolog
MLRKISCLIFLAMLAIGTAAQNDGSAKPAATPPVLTGGTKATAQPPELKNPNEPVAKPKSLNGNDDDVIKVDTDLVTTPVSVLDRSGRFIGGLRKQDFKIFENGVSQKVTYFQSEEQPFTVVLMIDVSPSTRYKIDDIHYAAVRFLDQLRPNDKVMVVCFDSRVRLYTPEPTSDRKALFAAIYKAQFGSGTSLYDAVSAVSQLEQMKITGRKAIVIFTDGVDTTSRVASLESTLTDAEELDALIYPVRYDTQQTANGNSAPQAVDLSKMLKDYPGVQIPQGAIIRAGRGQSAAEYERGRMYLSGLADKTRGRNFEADSTTNMDTAFAGIAEELRRQYSIGYYPEKPGAPGEHRSIKIQVLQHPNIVVRAKHEYVFRRNRPSDSEVNN